MRPSSSISRPGTSLSHHRPTSRLSQRPSSSASRLSHLPPSRHAQRFQSQIHALVTQITGLTSDDDEDDFAETCDVAARTLDSNRYTGLSPDMREVEDKLDGLVEKAQIKGQDTLATAMLETRNLLKERVGQSQLEDRAIKEGLLPDHLHFLLLFANAPSNSTHKAAVSILRSIHNPPPPEEQLTWDDILAEEPFVGDHWLMPPSPGSSTSSDQWSDLQPHNQSDSEGSLSPDDQPASPRSTPKSESQDTSLEDVAQDQDNRRRDVVEELQSRQYWAHAGHLQPDMDRPFNIGDPSTLGPTLAAVLYRKDVASLLERQTYLPELDATREVLLALQGICSSLFEVRQPSLSVEVSISAPRLLHTSLGTFRSLLASFATLATTLFRLRSFVKAVYQSAGPSGTSANAPSASTNAFKTLFAYAEGLDNLLNQFNEWCSNREQHIYQPTNDGVVTLLSLHDDVQKQTNDTFNVLWTITSQLFDLDGYFSHSLIDLRLSMTSPCSVSKAILDNLLRHSQAHLSMGNASTASTLHRLFVVTALPLWNAIGSWLKDGAKVDEDYRTGQAASSTTSNSEFFILTAGGLLDGSWQETSTLRTDATVGGPPMVPMFLRPVAEQILSAGKAVGLLRALSVDDFFYDGEDVKWLSVWSPFDNIFTRTPGSDPPSPGEDGGSSGESLTPAVTDVRLALLDIDRRLSDTSADAVTDTVQDYLSPLCRLAQSRLHHVLVETCRLWDHLECIEDVFFMGRGDILTDFAEVLFARMDAKKPWADYHLLNGAFRDVVNASPCDWIDAGSIRLSFRGAEQASISRTVRALEGLSVEYQVPFPLNYVFNPSAIQQYSAVFVSLLQLRRAKKVVDNMLMKGIITVSAHVGADELKAFYALRGKLSWIVNTYTDYMMAYVLHARVLRLHQNLQNAQSLDEMITVHQEHLDMVTAQCLLTAGTATLRRSIIAVLDMCLAFSDTFSAFTSDTSLDITRHSLIILREDRRSGSRPRRKRRLRQSQRRLRQNVIGFTPDAGSDSSDEDTDSSGDIDLANVYDDGDDAGAVSFEEESFLTRIENMTMKLDDLVRFIRRGVNDLALEGTHSAFSVLSFMLEDWDR